jgi:hypothetical protein
VPASELVVGPEYHRFLYYDLKWLTGDDVPRVRAAAQLVNSVLPT